MSYTEVDALNLDDVSDADLWDAKVVLVTDNYKDRTLGEIRDAIKKAIIRNPDLVFDQWTKIGEFTYQSSFTTAVGASNFAFSATTANPVKANIYISDEDEGATDQQTAYGELEDGDLLLIDGKNVIQIMRTIEDDINLQWQIIGRWLNPHDVADYTADDNYDIYSIKKGGFLPPTINDLSISKTRRPQESDKIENETVHFYDIVNGNFYVSYKGGDWYFLGSTGNVAKNVFIGDFDRTTVVATVDIREGEYKELNNAVIFGVGLDLNSPQAKLIAQLQDGDSIFLGSKEGVVGTVSRRQAAGIAGTYYWYTVSVSWVSLFTGLTFDAEESVYFTEYTPFTSETIWEGTLTGNDTDDDDIVQLNAGKKFSDYFMLQFDINTNWPITVLADTFVNSRDFNLHAFNGTNVCYMYLRRVSDTQVRSVGGQSANRIRLNKILGIKSRRG